MGETFSTIDHIMWATPELESGCNEFEKLTGIRPVFGGKHPGFGTHNALASLDNDRYIEILSLDPEQTSAHPIAKQIGQYKQSAIFAFHIKRQELEDVAVIYRNAGIECPEPVHLERQRPDGEVLKWRLLIPAPSIFGRAIPIFIDWMDAAHPARSAPAGCELNNFEVGYPDNIELEKLYEKLEVGIPVHHSDEAIATATLTTPKGEVTLSGRLQ